MELKINDKNVELKYSLRSMMMYENVTNSTFAPSSITDIITLFYCVVITSMKDYSYSFDAFLDWLDENTDKLEDFSQWIQDINTNTEKLKKEQPPKTKKK